MPTLTSRSTPRHRRWSIVGGIVVVGVCVTSCQAAHPAAARSPDPLLAHEARVDTLLSHMTLAEKVGQMTQPDQEFLKDPADIERYALGSLLSGGNSDPKEGNRLEAWTDLYDRYQQHTAKTRLKIPLLYGIDAVHGHSNVLGAVIFPHNIGLGATRDPALVQQIAATTAQEVRATGIQWTFAPCVCVPQDARWGRTYEGFSEDPELVALLGAATIKGFQGPSLHEPLSVLATAKHYVADGGTAFGTGVGGRGLDQGDARIDEPTLRRIHLRPYAAAVAAGVGSIMVSYNSWNGAKLSGNHHLLTDVLKQELGFQGFLVSDYRAVNQIDPDYKTAIEQAINAGMDMVMVPDTYREFIQHLTELVNEGRVPMSRIDDAVRRILRVKVAMGLVGAERPPVADRTLHRSFGSAEHRAVARQAVRESVVLLKNRGRTLPLAKTVARLHVAGKSADNLGNQTGGWTISWQGAGGAVTPGGTTVLAAIKRAVSPRTTVTFSADGSGAAGADVAIAVIGETPYAEMLGDKSELALDSADLATVRNLKAAGVPVAVVIVSGRPLVLGSVLEQADALVAAWLPGTEGDGVADVLFGDYRPTGKLSYSWPRATAQLSIHKGDAGYDPLFPFGYGLTY
jgi:beta-glucosidase